MMINFATLVSRVTGFTPPGSDRATASGVATGGEFEALVQAAGGDLGMPAAGEASSALRLIVNNDAAAAHTASAVAGGEHAHVTHANSELINFVTGREIILPPPTKEALMTVPAEPAPAPAAPQTDKPVEPVSIKAQIVTSIAPPADPSTAIIATVPPQAQAEQAEADIEADAESVTEDSSEVSVQQAAAATPPTSGLATTIVAAALPVVAPNFRASVNLARTSSHTAVQPEAANSRPSIAAEPLLPTAQTEVAKSVAEQVRPAAVVEAEAPVLRSAAEPVQLAIPVDTAPAVRGVAGVQGTSTAEALGSRVIDMGVSGQWIDRLAREIAGVADGTGSSRFTLNPPHLGRLQVEIVQSADAMDVHLFTETDEAAQRLNEGRSALHADARVAAINLGQLTVEKSSAAFESGARDQGQGQREMAGQMQQQDDRQANGRAAQNERDGWSSRLRGDQTNQNEPDETTRATRRTRADSNVRFA